MKTIADHQRHQETETQTYMSFTDNYDSIATLEVHNGAWYPIEDAKQIGWIGTELNKNIFIGAQATRKWNTFMQREFDLTLNGNNSPHDCQSVRRWEQ